MTSKTSYIWWTSIISIHLAFLAYQLVHQRLYLHDSEEYKYVAQNLTNEQTLYSADLSAAIRYEHYTKRPPVYPVFWVIIASVFGTDGWVIFFQLLISIGNIYLLLYVLREIGVNAKVYLWLLPFLLLYPAQYIYTNLLMTEILFQSFLLLCLCLLLKAEANKRLKFIYLYTLVLLLAMLTKPVMYLFFVPHACLMFYWTWKWRKWQLLIIALLPFLFVSSYSYWNDQRTGYFHFSSIQNKSLLQYTTYHLLMQEEGAEKARRKVDEIEDHAAAMPDFAESQRYIQAESRRILTQYAGTYLWFHLKGMLNFFIDPGRFDLYHFFGIEQSDGQGFLYHFSENGYRGVWGYLKQQPIGVLLLLIVIAFVNALKLLALSIFPFTKTLRWEQKVLVLLPIFYLAALTGINGASRFAVPVFPMMLLVMAVVLDSAFLHKNKRVGQLVSGFGAKF